MTANAAVLNSQTHRNTQKDRDRKTDTEGQRDRKTGTPINLLIKPTSQPTEREIDTNTVIFILNRTFLVCFGGISDKFGQAMVRILAIRSWVKIPMARPNKPNMPSKRTKNARLGISFSSFPTLFAENGAIHTLLYLRTDFWVAYAVNISEHLTFRWEMDHHGSKYITYSFRRVCGFFYVPRNKLWRVVRRGLRFIDLIRED